MEKNQKKKLIVAISFFAFFTAISLIAFFTIILPNREKRKKSGEKINMKTGYKTKVNPDMIDSLMKAQMAKDSSTLKK